MTPEFFENVVTLGDLKINPGRVVKQVGQAHRPVLVTRRGQGVAVVQALADFEQAEEERSFMRAVVQGIVDLESEPETELAQAKKRLGLA